MPHSPLSPAMDHPTSPPQAHARAAPAAELTFEERLSLTNAAMSVRLDEAAVAYEVNASHIETEPVALADVVSVPLTPTLPPPPAPYPTPVAALLQRAHHRLLTGGWCSGALLDAEGARCLYGAIHTEARGDHALESRALEILMDQIRRQFGDSDSVPAFNDAFSDRRIPLRTLDRAASLADARGL